MGTSDDVSALAVSLAQEGRDTASAVADLRESSLGKRVAVVMAKQKLEGGESTDDTNAAIALLDATLKTSTWT